MATYIALVDYTDQGIRGIGDTPHRADDFAKAAEKVGVKIEQLYWTMGGHDGVVILDAPDDEAVAALLLALGAKGNVRTQTLRAFDRSEIESILGKKP
jgi:uncharacterized protein with GYD domain